MNRRILSLSAGLLCLALLLSSCAPAPGDGGAAAAPEASPAPSAYQKITADQAKALMDEGGVTVVDVRRPDEYEAGHIPGAVNLPNEDISDVQPDALPDLDAPLVVYCRTGVRSKDASDKLVAMGYTSVSDMGGIVDWPYDTVIGSEPGAYAPGAQASDAPGILSSFTTVDLDGNEVDQSLFSDYDVTMINVWATFCGPCLREMPDLGELSGEYADKGLRIVGLVTDVLNSDGSYSEAQLDTARDIVSTTGADYLHLLPSQDLYGILSQMPYVPTTLFVDSEGRQVGSTYQGSMSKADWVKVIDQMLAEVAK